MSFMEERRKRVLLIAASILAARKLGDWGGGGPMSPKEAGVIGDAVRIAQRIMERIDREYPEPPKSNWRDGLRDKDSRH